MSENIITTTKLEELVTAVGFFLLTQNDASCGPFGKITSKEKDQNVRIRRIPSTNHKLRPVK